MEIGISWWQWVIYFCCAVIGGVAGSLANNNGGVILPEKKDGTIMFGVLSDILLGLAASVAVLWILNPSTVVQFLGTGVVSGYSGSSILRALSNKMLADRLESENSALKVQNSMLAARFHSSKPGDVTGTEEAGPR